MFSLLFFFNVLFLVNKLFFEIKKCKHAKQQRTRFTVEQLAVMAACVGGPGLAAIFYSLCTVTHRRSGMPDLFLWHEERMECRLSEVKSPNDRLSDKQIAWLETFAENGIDSEVCLVRVKGGNQK